MELPLVCPLSGWCAALAEVPDEVFAGGMMGDGLAIDPVDNVLLAPCDGEIAVLPGSAHALTLTTAIGADILLHVGLDTVALKGAGFEPLVRQGERIRRGQPLIRFDLDRLARAARSLVTPVVVTDPGRFAILNRGPARRVRAGEPLMTLRLAATAPAPAATPAGAGTAVRELEIGLAHGLHARPAALMAATLRDFRGEFTLSLRGRTVNARSAVAIMSLGARHGDRIELRGAGDDVALAAAELARALARMRDIGAAAAPSPSVPAGRGPVAAGAMRGTRASPGIAVGVAVPLLRAEFAVPADGADPARELAALDSARAKLRRRLLDRQTAGGARDEILGAHLEFLDDPELLAAAHADLAAGRSAGFAWRAAVRRAIAALDATGDAHLAARADDLRDLEWQMLETLTGTAAPHAQPLPERAILIARELLPSQLLALDAARIAGICTVSAAATSHVAILAQSLELPMLCGADPAVLEVPAGTPLLLDADAGFVAAKPDGATQADAQRRLDLRREQRSQLRAAAREPGRTADGARIEVLANIASGAEAAAAVQSGAEGCGLLRTEFLFLDRAESPPVEEQARCYQAIADAFDGRPVVIRTLDAGADKAMPFLAMPREDNPALGLRGIRAGLWRPELLRAQLAAVLAVRPAGRCRILLPMVNDPAEVVAVRAMLDGLEPGNRMPLGIMIETPAAAMLAARLARHAEFFSIGTNDLTQYALATDRTHPLLAARLDALHPAVLRLMARVCEAARTAGRPVAVCGGLAADPQAVAVLLGLGVIELSAPPAAIPALKDALRRLTMAHCRALAARALELDSAAEVRELLAP